jgi:hypothetical protein
MHILFNNINGIIDKINYYSVSAQEDSVPKTRKKIRAFSEIHHSPRVEISMKQQIMLCVF